MNAHVEVGSGARRLLDVRCKVGESPYFDARSGLLVFADVTGRMVFSADLDTGKIRPTALHGDVGAILPRASGGFVAACGGSLIAIDLDRDGTLRPGNELVRVEERSTFRLNDAVAALDGSVWVGSMSYDLTPGTGRLLRVTPDGAVTIALEGLTLPNGLQFVDEERLVFVDSMAGGLDLLTIAGGAVRSRDRIADVPKSDGLIDGLCLDVEGGVWVALWSAARVRRYTLDGRITQEFQLPVSMPTACTIVGAMLVVTSASEGLAAAALREQPDAGAVFAIDGVIAGQEEPLCRS